MARLTLLDWLGCILAARRTPVARALGRAHGAPGEDPVALVFSAASNNAQCCAFLTGALGNVLEMDDLHRRAILHAGDTVCAAALAVGLARDVRGSDLLAAIVRGYEAAIRVGIVAASGGYTPFYNSGTCGVFGAAMAAADLHGLDAGGMADALGQAGMQAAGVWQCRLEPTYSKQLACAHAARAGVLSAELAAAGFPGARRILTGPLGFFASYYPQGDASGLVADPNGDWSIAQVSVKPFAACRHTHPAIGAALLLRSSPQNAEIAIVTVDTYGAALAFCNAPAPTTPDAARFSLQHTVAVALLRGAPKITDFEEPSLTDPAIVALRKRVVLRCDPALDAAFPEHYGAQVRVTLSDGTCHERSCPSAWGDPKNPMSEADLVAKFKANARYGGLQAAEAEALCAAIFALPDAADLSRLHDVLTRTLTLNPELA